MSFEGKVYKCKRCRERFLVSSFSTPAIIKTNFYRFGLMRHRDWSGGGKFLCPDCAKAFRRFMGGEEPIPFRRLGDGL